MKAASSWLIYGLGTAVGILALVYPFFLPGLPENGAVGQVRQGEMPLMLTVLLALCVAILLFEVQSQAVDAKIIALVGMLVAVNSALRFLEIAIPGPGGFSPIFFLIILTGYVYGGRIGFLMGAITLLVSAFVTGGVGPWLPGQMFTAGWVGMSAGLCSRLATKFKLDRGRREVALLTTFGAAWGVLYGVVINLWSWPFFSGPAEQYWSPGTGLAGTVGRYASYYLVTSLVWDLGRALGNALLLILFGAATIRVMRRFKQRFLFQYQP